MTKLSAEQNKMIRKMAVDSANSWMTAQISVLERSAQDLRRYQERFMEAVADEDAGKQVSMANSIEHLSWFVNQMHQSTSNFRTDMAVKHAAALMSTLPNK